MKEIAISELAQKIYNLSVGQILHFKIFHRGKTEMYGVTRTDLFDCDNIFMSFYGDRNSAVFNASIDHDVKALEFWLREVINANDFNIVYLMGQHEVYPNHHELWGITFKTTWPNSQPYRTQVISECALFRSREDAQDWINNHSEGPYDSAFPADKCSDPKPVLIDEWEDEQ